MCMGMILRLHLGGGEKPDGVCIVIVHRTHRIANGTARRTVHGTIHSIWRCIAHRTVRGMSQHPFSLTRLLLRCSIHRITHRGMRGHPAITSHRTSHHPSKDTSHRTSHRALHCRPYEKGAIFVFLFRQGGDELGATCVPHFCVPHVWAEGPPHLQIRHGYR